MTITALPRLLTARAVANQLGIPLHRVYALCRRGILPHVSIGRSYRFDPEVLRQWIRAGGTVDGESAS